MIRDLHRVTCKAILFNAKRTKVLLANYDGKGWYGLPGGHLDAGETPDEATHRELQEELGVEGLILHKDSFDVHEDGKVILYYCAEIDEGTIFRINTREMARADWVEISKIVEQEVSAGGVYDSSILRNAMENVL